MKTGKTDQLIIDAIAALPYRRPAAGFSARVMAAAARPAEESLQDRLLKAAGLVVAAWSAVLVFGAGKLVYANLGDIAALLIQPGGPRQVLGLIAARAVLALADAAAALSLAADVLAAAASGLPAWYEIAAAALLCSAAIAALSHGARLAHDRI